MPRVVDHSVDEARPVGRRWCMGCMGEMFWPVTGILGMLRESPVYLATP